jgi:tRNA dimethylallyltransferase
VTASRLIALFGPTAIGKTAVAIELAERMRARGEDPVAISADALQVYRGLETLTGAATPDERRRLEHRLLGFVPLADAFSVGAYMPLAHAEIDAALAAARTPIVVGGTGLYLRAALCELDLRAPPAPGVRRRIEDELERDGAAALHSRLEERAPTLAATVRPTDRSRLVRALELLEMGEDPGSPGAESQLWTAEMRVPTLLVGLVMERSALYQRIDARVDALVAAGAAEEVRRAEQAGASPTARMALGYRELLEGDVEGMQRRSRNYAKRQLSWMRKLAGVRVIDVTGLEPSAVAAEIERSAAQVAPRPPGHP